MKYDFAAIEKKWQDKWEQVKPYAAVTGDKRPKFYGLIEFPYPSAAGLHVGHPRPFTAMDIICRKKRMQGYNVLNPIGFDAFGLPTENFAIKNHIHPAIVTQQNIKNFTRQLKMLGYGFDWDRVIDTTDPQYYKWTQWIFLQLFKNDLAYKTTMPVNWCTSCKCVLANEEVVEGGDITKEAFTLKDDTGIMVNSGFLNGMTVKEAIPAMKKYAVEQGWGHEKVNYKLRDWVFSRQRYWGEPIPLVNCPKCGWVPVPEEELPLVLPQVDSYELTDDGESPLSKMTDWVNTKCPKCGCDAKRETDTMPQWAGSSWYFLRYMDPHNDHEPVSHEAEQYWGPVDWYNGGMEHTTLHLLYSRFWHKFLYDIGVVHTKEPYAKRTSHGMILGQNPHYVGNVSTQEEKDALIAKYGNQALRPAVKMSKSLGNVVNPDDVVKAYGADTMRLYIMFIGDFEKVATWSDDAVKGCKRFLDRVWNLADQVTEEDGVSEKNAPIVHKTIKKVTDDIDTLKMNTAIAALMAMVNEFYSNGLSRGDFEALLLMLSPFAPHMVEELWEQKGFAAKYEGKMAMQCAWPEYDESKTVASSVEMAVQVSGKFKGTIIVPVDSDQDTVVEAAKASEKVAKAIAGMQIVNVIHVMYKIVNLIVKPC